jgi:hypothetical protein
MSLEPEDVNKLADAVKEESAIAPPRPHELAKRRIEETVFRLVKIIQRDKQRVLSILREESDRLIEECRNGTRPRHSFLPMAQEVFAKRLLDNWTEEEQKDIQVFEGYCLAGKHQWFVVSGEPEEVQEPYWDYIVDPIPGGLLVFNKDDGAPADIVVIPPMSLWAKNYLGAPEEMMRLAEQREQAGAGV